MLGSVDLHNNQWGKQMLERYARVEGFCPDLLIDAGTCDVQSTVTWQ